jgi:phage terminase Nu1 subunit (DNA packaging protein)
MSHIVRSLREVGEHFGRCTRTAQRWRRAGMPKTHGRGYDLQKCEEWLRRAKNAGASLRQQELEAEINRLVELAATDLRAGLIHLCQAYLRARGQNRERLLDLATKRILKGTLFQLGLLEKKGGEAP